MQPQPTQSTIDLGLETTDQSFNVPQSPEVTAFEAYQDSLKQAEKLKYALSDAAYAQASIDPANLRGDDQLDPEFFAAIGGSNSLDAQISPETVTPEEWAWVGAVASNLVAMRQHVLSQNDFGLGV